MSCIIQGTDWGRVHLPVELDPRACFIPAVDTPWNLGVCPSPGLWESDSQAQKYIGQAQKYIGFVPLLRLPQGNVRWEKVPEVFLRIDPRADFDPCQMLKHVMEGDDYYGDPALFRVTSITPDQLLRYQSGKGRPKWDGLILFGRLEGVGKLPLEQLAGSGAERFLAALSPGMADALGVMEIMDFLQKTRRLLQKNVLHTLERVEENLTGKVRGKILIGKQIRVNEMRGQRQKVYCSYTRLSDNNRENRILRWTLQLCEAYGQGRLADAMMEDILFCKRELAEVPLIKCGLNDFVGLKVNGAYRDYYEALEAARQIIASFSISYANAANERSKNQRTLQVRCQPREITPFFLNMDYLFELYCRAVLRKALDDFNRDKSVRWSLEPKVSKKLLEPGEKAGGVFMTAYETDMTVLDEAGLPVAVLDAKNALIDNAYPKHRARTHQLLFYMQALGCHYGGLILRGEQSVDPLTLWRNGKEPRQEDHAGFLAAVTFSGAECFGDHAKKLQEFLEQAFEARNREPARKDADEAARIREEIRTLIGGKSKKEDLIRSLKNIIKTQEAENHG